MILADIVTPAITTIKQLRTQLTEVERFLHDNEAWLDRVCDEYDFIRAIEVHPTHLNLVPNGDPADLEAFFSESFDCLFTRTPQIDGLYQWETILPNYNLPIRIQANEVIDLSGSLVK